MVAPEGREYAPYLTLQAAESLVRSLVGVAAVSLKADANGILREIEIVPEAGVSARRLGQDVVSALKARFGLSLHPEAITIAAPEAETDAERLLGPEWPVSSIASDLRDRGGPQDRPKRNGSTPLAGESDVSYSSHERVTGLAGGAREGRTHWAGPSVDPANAAMHGGNPAPRLERAEVEAVERGLRCRITVAVGDERFHGVAESAGGFSAEAELAARVTLDALRSARTPPEPLQYQGVSLIDMAGRPHVVVSLAVWTGNEFEPLAGAEPVRDTIADAAARAVVSSVIAHMGGEARPRA